MTDREYIDRLPLLSNKELADALDRADDWLDSYYYDLGFAVHGEAAKRLRETATEGQA